MRICDLRPATDDGQYVRSRLELTPRDSAVKSGRWSHRTPTVANSDWTTHTIAMYAEDVVGNRTEDGLTMSFVVDTEAPVITVTRVVTEIQVVQGSVPLKRSNGPDVLIGAHPVAAGNVETVLWGTVSESGPVVRLSAHVHAPDGSAHRRQAALSGESWWVDLEPLQKGIYTIWLEAKDQAGNAAVIGPFEVEVKGPPAPPVEPEPVGGHTLPAVPAMPLRMRTAFLVALGVTLLAVGAAPSRKRRAAGRQGKRWSNRS